MRKLGIGAMALAAFLCLGCSGSLDTPSPTVTASAPAFASDTPVPTQVPTIAATSSAGSAIDMAPYAVQFQTTAGNANTTRTNALSMLVNDGTTITYLPSHLSHLRSADGILRTALARSKWGPLADQVAKIDDDLVTEQADLGKAIKLGFGPKKLGQVFLAGQVANEIAITNRDIEGLLSSMYMPLPSELPVPAFKA